MNESLSSQAATDAKIDALVDSGKYSYSEARVKVTGIREDVPDEPDERTLARERAHQEYTEMYHLTGTPTPEQVDETQQAMQGEAYRQVKKAATKAYEVSIGDPTVAAAILAARAGRVMEDNTEEDTESLADSERLAQDPAKGLANSERMMQAPTEAVANSERTQLL